MTVETLTVGGGDTDADDARVTALAELRERREEAWTASKAGEWREAHLASREENDRLRREAQSLRDELAILRNVYATALADGKEEEEEDDAKRDIRALVDLNVSTLRGQLLEEARERLETTSKALREREEENARLEFALRRLEEGDVRRLAEDLQRAKVLGEARGRLIDSLDVELNAVRAEEARSREEHARLAAENARMGMELAAERERSARLEAELSRQIALNEKLTDRLVVQGNEIRAVKSSVMLASSTASPERFVSSSSSSSSAGRRKSSSARMRNEEIVRRDLEVVRRRRRQRGVEREEEEQETSLDDEDAVLSPILAPPPLSFVSEETSPLATPGTYTYDFVSRVNGIDCGDKSLQMRTIEALQAKLGEVVREAKAFREEAGRERAALIGSLAAAEARARAEMKRAEDYKRDVRVSRFLAKQAVGRLAASAAVLGLREGGR